MLQFRGNSFEESEPDMSQQATETSVAIDLRTEQHIPMSYDEFLEFATDIHAEWVNGEAIIFMPPKTIHQQLVLFLSSLMLYFARSRNLGEVLIAPFAMRTGPEAPAREPDILFVAREHLDRLTTDRLEGAADLIIEVVSDSSLARDRADKFYEYQEAGVREYWIIDPRPGKERADFYQLMPDGKYQAALPDADGRYRAEVLPGFWLRVDWLWQEQLPDPLLVLREIAPDALREVLS
jgi:Uma2 family endonuclease